MLDKETEIVERLFQEDEEFRRLKEKHQTYEKELEELNKSMFLSSEQERKRIEIKKMKLAVKDKMESILRRYRQKVKEDFVEKEVNTSR